jgi:Zn-finger nucleic acid-binding protein
LAPTTLYTLAQAPHLAFALEDAFADQTPIPLLASEMPCPLCGALMERAFLAVAPSMEIERCPQCGLIWLDDGELAKLGQTLQRSVPSAPTDEQAGETPATAPPTWVYCAHCGRENFSDATECWACGEPLVPEQPPLPGFAQRMAEWVAMALGGTGAILFGTFVARPLSV